MVCWGDRGAYKDACVAFVMFPYIYTPVLATVLSQRGKRRRKKDSEVYEHGLLILLLRYLLVVRAVLVVGAGWRAVCALLRHCTGSLR